MRKLASAAAIVLLAAAPAMTQPRPSFTERLTATAGTKFAIRQICLPAVRDGAAPDGAVFKGLAPRKPPAYSGQTTYWIGPDVTVSSNGKSCTVRATDGQGDALREVALASLRESVGELTTSFDNGPDDRDSSGTRYRQERHCFGLGATAGYVVISSSPDRGRVPLQLTVGLAAGTPCETSRTTPSPAAPGGRP